MKPYRNGKHMQLRGAGGQFRHADLSDLNLGSAICSKCGALNPYSLFDYVRNNGFVERKRNDPPTICNQCGASLWKD